MSDKEEPSPKETEATAQPVAEEEPVQCEGGDKKDAKEETAEAPKDTKKEEK